MQSKTAISVETSPRLGSKKPQSSCGGRSRALCASFFRGSEKDLEAQLGRLVLYARGRGLNIIQVVSEVGSGLNGHRPKLLRRYVAVLVPQMVERRWVYYFLHSQTETALKLILYRKGNGRIIVVNVPRYLRR